MTKITFTRALPSLNALRAFEAAGRLKSFQLAAQELHVTAAAVSRHVKLLEEELGFPLFDRGHRSVALTSLGQQYLADIAEGFDSLKRATQDVVEASQKRKLRIQAYTTVAMKWLVPRLASFHAASPEIEVSLTTSLEDVDFSIDALDGAIRLSNPPLALGADKLMANELVPVCSPAFMDRHSQIQGDKTEGLRGLTLLHSLARRQDWRKWLSAAGVQGVNPLAGLSYESSTLAYQAAIHGHGLAIAQRALVMQELAAGDLVMPFSFVLDEGDFTYYLVYPHEHLNRPEFAAFRSWLISV
ncbi:transcriptional regulator GcvA [Bordetella muralis]|uniref:transcriptional regulator GcvA n=1 Tax=Bordetella muralis TaxID=1649130 RepID=UPI0039EE5B5C